MNLYPQIHIFRQGLVWLTAPEDTRGERARKILHSLIAAGMVGE
ncbi:MAG: hypothetical protein ACD_62C00288G0003 [uncultured bacterium]|nr:MAG: hypothetical protein ACD_62C00288G0003 [uncultured bacterium]HLD45760.1 hypothetical protein [bacterium]